MDIHVTLDTYTGMFETIENKMIGRFDNHIDLIELCCKVIYIEGWRVRYLSFSWKWIGDKKQVCGSDMLP